MKYYENDRNDPGRFFGDGVQFKAKLIGILEVGEARGDRMCQEALQDLKMAIRAAGEHKQRITIHVTIDGLRLRDEKTGDSLYHHPVHKISFIAQDMTDSRAFGYIFGSPDSGHRFFGIKTDKAASQVVLAMRDLFQVVFELKKKEIELARQQIQSKAIHDHQLTSLTIKNGSLNTHNSLSGASGSGFTASNVGESATSRSGDLNSLGSHLECKGVSKELSPESVADLVDLEQELNSIQRGITQMERITPNDVAISVASGTRSGNDDDPFGDSFTNFPAFNLLPPPESGRRNKSSKINENTNTSSCLLSSAPTAGIPSSTATSQENDDGNWLNEIDQRNHVFDTAISSNTNIELNCVPITPLVPTESTTTTSAQQSNEQSGFSELELCSFGAVGGLTQGIDRKERFFTSLKSDTSANDAPVMMSHETDPFSPTRKKSDPDPFPDGDIFSKQGKFETVETSDSMNSNQDLGNNPTQPQVSLGNTTDVFNSPLQVSLPPENSGETPSCQSTSPDWRADISYLEIHDESNKARSRPITSAQRLSVSSSSYTQASVLKQQTVDVISSISNKKMPHLFGQARFSKRDSNSINMRRLQESDSLSENETAPEPPPRPDATTYVEPPPLPPKRQLNDNITRTRIPFGIETGIASGAISTNHYESVNAIAKYNTNANRDGVPPIPLPSRRLGKSDGDFPGPERPKKPGHTDDDYLTPISATTTGFCSSSKQSVPPLLPPPTHLSSRSRAQRQQPVDIYENKEEILLQQQELMKEVHCSLECNPPIVPDITLTQLLTLGIDDLAKRLNVPTSKLSTMTLVELTAYLSDFLCSENTKPKQVSQESHDTGYEAAVFKVNFDQQSTFIAKFDDTFGEDLNQGETSFVANFEQFNQSPNEQISSFIKHNVPTVPSADRYAVFREIIDQEMQQLQENTDLMGDLTPPSVDEQNYQVSSSPSHLDQDADVHFEAKFDKNDLLTSENVQPAPSLVLPKIDTKITEVVAQAKDRYAALRDIILVENLFDKVSPVLQDKTIISEFTEFSDEFNEDQDLKQIMDDRESSIGTADRLGIVDSRCLPAEPSSSAITVEDDEDEEDGGDESSGDSNEKDAELGESYPEGFIQDRYEKLSTSMQQLNCEKGAADKVFQTEKNQTKLQVHKQDNKFLTVSPNNALFTSKDDFEIDELMQRAISNLSLDSREIISPAHSLNLTTQRQVTSSAPTQSQYNDVSTSPIPLQPSLVENESNKYKPQIKTSPKAPTISSQLSAVSQLIDTVSKKLSTNEREGSTEINVNSWATFDTSKRESEINSEKYNGHKSKHKSTNSLHLPPPPPSNASINDPAESPCSSDQREEGWRKSANNRRWPKLERQQTSSSSRDISPWDDEAPDYQKHKPRLHPPTVHADRHYYVRHTKRMNSCDEDYDYEDDLAVRRDQRKFKQGLSRSRDNFDLDSPSWYHHAPYTWTAKDIEQARGRFFDRNAYERTTYGPPLFDKRGVGFPPLHSGSSSYDRRVAAGSYDKRKYYRDYGRPNYEVEDFGEAPAISDRSMYRGDSGSFEKIKMTRRPDYENLNDEGSRYKSKAEYMYERERKSFDRESLDSFDSSSRKRKSFGSGGDVYGSLENRDEFRDRYVGGSSNTSKNRSLRRGTKLRVAGDIDYEQDSEGDFQQPQPRGRVVESRSLQRPSQLSTSGLGILSSQTRVRKSSGSSPWDGEETQVIGIKQWKRPTSATESERRLVESRRSAAINALPSGSDGEKDRRFRKKHRPRGTKGLYAVGSGCGSPPGSSCSRYGNIAMTSRNHENFDYMACDDDLDDDDEDYVDDEPPTDEDKFERINRRRHEVHQKMHESERRSQNTYKVPQVPYKTSGPMPFKKYQVNIHNDFDFDGDFEHNPTPISNDSSIQAINNQNQGKFEFDAGFESDFKQNSPPSAIDGTVSSSTSTYPTNVNTNNVSTGNKSTFRFSNDFSDREGSNIASSNSLQETEQFDTQPVVSPITTRAPQPVQQKLRFDDKVKVSKFDGAAFEDDFSKANFDFNKDDQWHVESLSKSSNGSIEIPVGSAAKKQTLRNNKLQQRQELIKKSESINIFAKKNEDPFEDDEFFKEPTTTSSENTGQDVCTKSDNKNTNYELSGESNFATFDKNM